MDRRRCGGSQALSPPGGASCILAVADTIRGQERQIESIADDELLATKGGSATELLPSLAGRAVYLVCKGSNRLFSEHTDYWIYFDDLGLFLHAMESEYRTGQHRRYVSFDVSR